MAVCGAASSAWRRRQSPSPAGWRGPLKRVRPVRSIIATIEPGSPAARAGLLARDILVAIDGKAIEGVDDLMRRLNADKIGQEVTVSLLRGGRRIDFRLTPTERAAA